jgi:60 kDa SS-A/Ro ribonucleoprotein
MASGAGYMPAGPWPEKEGKEMADALAKHMAGRTRGTPQTEPAREDQVKNNAGGFVFGVSEETRLHRFLTIGTEGGTYYVNERDLTRDNAGVVVSMAKASNRALITQAVAVSENGRAPRNDPALFALAAAAGMGHELFRAEAFAELPKVARTGSHIISFAKYMELFRGWGPQAVKGVGRWFTSKDADALAYQLLKYKSRGDWAQRDLLRLSHFGRVPLTPEHRALFAYVMKGEVGDGLAQVVHASIAAHKIAASPIGRASVRAWTDLIRSSFLSWEMLPSEALNEPEVWRALIESNSLPQGALIRQLPRLTTIGLLKPGDVFTSTVAGLLAAPERLKRARVHPIAVLLALKTYAGGHSLRGSGTWNPVSVISDGLDAAFYSSFGAVEPAGKRIMECLDVSGSMSHPAGGLPISCREVVAAMAMVSVKTEQLATTWGFSHKIMPLDISPRRRLDDVVKTISGLPFDHTDCSLPMVLALKKGMPVDVFRVSTDNETWHGSIHPHQALENYRQATGIDARLQVVAITPTEFSIADPLDRRQLDVSGFDSAVPTLLASHARGDL